VQRHVAPWILSFVALFWLWMLLVGEWNQIELIYAACVAAFAATVGQWARTIAEVTFRVPARPFLALPSALAMVFVDFGIAIAALLRRRRGEFVVRESQATQAGELGVGDRAFSTLVANYSPNAYVIDVQADDGTVLLHDLVPYRKSEEPA
jgi:multisubunit Na+/H+ antiporter MnhE subunit